MTLMANQMNFKGGRFRDFPAFPNVGQTIKTFMSVQNAATFMAGAGALAGCPGPGCYNQRQQGRRSAGVRRWPTTRRLRLRVRSGTRSVTGTAPSYGNPGAGNRRGIIRISNGVGAPHFGGTRRSCATPAERLARSGPALDPDGEQRPGARAPGARR